MALFTDFLPNIRLLLPNVTEPTAIRELKNCAQQFFERTKVYVVTIEFDCDPLEQFYPLSLPFDTQLVAIKKVSCDRTPLTGSSEDGQLAVSSPGKPKFFYESQRDLALSPTPDKSYKIKVTCCVKPTTQSEEIPDDLFEDWHYAIEQGAVARLASMPERTWSSPAIANNAYALYMQEISEAKKYSQGRQHSTPTAKFRW
jgi:hypothetical protein